MPALDTIFITGFPGFIAARLVRRLADGDARFQILVQPAFMAQAEQDVRHIAGATGKPLDTFRLIPGDITAEGLGMSATDAEAVRRDAGIIFHLAAIYDLAVRRDLAMSVNVAGTQNVNRFARTMSALRHYHYVSTCYVAGKRTGTIFEHELAHDAGFRNHYEETKYLAELEVENLKSEVPITIHRPSVVCGDSHTGETAKFDGIYYLINYLRKRPALLALANIGNPAVRLNIVPLISSSNHSSHSHATRAPSAQPCNSPIPRP
jgi:thioester reductase-like protein